MNKSLKIAFCSSEVFPYAKTGGLGDVCGALPLALEKLRHTITVVLPYYKCVKEGPFAFEEIGPHVQKTTMGKDITVLCIRQDEFFDRKGFYMENGKEYKDNCERFVFFCQKALEALHKSDPSIDIVHCHDWHTALIPVYLKRGVRGIRFLKKAKSLLTLHNMAFQGIFPADEVSGLGLKPTLKDNPFIEYYGKMNFLKAGILESDAVTTVSPTYAQEIQGADKGCGLENVVRKRKGCVKGILNGIDTQIWDPAQDTRIPFPYSPENAKGKAENKRQLQQVFDLPVDQDIPVFGCVGRLTEQKGLKLILESISQLMLQRMQFVFLGEGEKVFEKALLSASISHPDKIAVNISFNEQLAHLIYAGSDFFLMPSHFEPCGLSQMISLIYGTIPIVFKTGGLADTIHSFDNQGNGFMFEEFSSRALIQTLEEACRVFGQKDLLGSLIDRAFKYDFSWKQSAQKYEDIYRQLVS